MTWQAKLDSTRDQLRGLNKTIPDTTRAFGALGKAVKEGGTLDFKTKEFVALGIAVVKQCDACIALHVETLIKSGAKPRRSERRPRNVHPDGWGTSHDVCRQSA